MRSGKNYSKVSHNVYFSDVSAELKLHYGTTIKFLRLSALFPTGLHWRSTQSGENTVTTMSFAQLPAQKDLVDPMKVLSCFPQVRHSFSLYKSDFVSLVEIRGGA